MVDYSQRIKDLESEIKKTQYNKATQHHIGLVKAQIARLKEKEESRRSSKGSGHGYSVRKSGDATVIMLGFPSVGKSTLLNALTNANSEVGSYAFTTLTVIPGLLEHNHAKIQVLDVPGVVAGAAAGTGKGREVLAVMRNADLVLLLFEALHPEQEDIILKEAYDAHLRLNQSPPDIRIKKTPKGGINLGLTVKLTKIKPETIVAVLRELGINNAEVVIRSDISVDQLIDSVEGNKKYLPSIIVLNKIDAVPKQQIPEFKRQFKADICISARDNQGIDELKEIIFRRLNFIRVYCKEVGKKADLDVPMIMFRDATVEDMCSKLHRDFVNKFRFARLWGKSVKFPGQKLGLKHRLADRDVVEIHLK